MRTGCLALGLATLAVVWGLPLARWFGAPFSAHMTMHMGVVAIAAPLLAFGIAGSRFDPVRRVPGWFPPIPLSIVELVVVWAWHAPALHHAARHSGAVTVVEQGSFLASGLLVWLSTVGGDSADRANRGGAGVLALLLTSMHMTLFGALLALPPRPLYGSHAGAVHQDGHQHAAALSLIDDQHLGGAIMLVVGGISYLAGGLWLAIELLRRKAERPSRGGAASQPAAISRMSASRGDS